MYYGVGYMQDLPNFPWPLEVVIKLIAKGQFQAAHSYMHLQTEAGMFSFT